MFATPYFRTAFKLLILATVLVAAPACRTGTTPEAGVDAQLFEKPGAAVSYNPRGYWFAVAPQNATLTDYVSLAHDGQTELFYAVAKGERAAQLLPLTPVASTWFAAAVEAGATPTFLDNLEQAQISDTVGLWTGKASDAVTWLGEAPSKDVSAVALPAAAPTKIVPFSRWARGVVSVSTAGDRAGRTQETLDDGPFVLLPESAQRQQGLRVVNLSTGKLFAPRDPQISVETNQGPQFGAGSLFEYASLPVGRRQNADLLFFEAENALFVFHIGPEHARLGSPSLGNGARLVASVADTPLMLRDPKAAPNVMRGFQALREGRTLAAAFWLRPDELGMPTNKQASALRLAELPAAAGMTQWSRVALLEAADGMTADRVLYLARAHALEGDVQKAISYASRSADSFGNWPEPGASTGAARANLLRAHLEHVQGDDQQAIELTQSAIDGFKYAEDVLRQADAELQLADYLFSAASPDNAIKYANLARSRYYHGGSPYYSALAEIKLAELLLENGQIDQALEMAGFARARMEKFDEPIGLARAALVEALAKKAAGQTRDISGQLKNALVRARAHKDLRSQALAAAALVNHGGVATKERMVEIGSLLIASGDQINDPVVSRQVQRAVATLCGQGLARAAADVDTSTSAPTAERACTAAVKRAAEDPATIRAWLEQGWRALQHGKLGLAQSTTAELSNHLDDTFAKTSPVLAAEVLLFRYAVETAPSADGDSSKDEASANEALLDEAVALLDNGLDPKDASSKLHELANTHRARGLTDVAGALGARAMNQARAAKQYDQERELLFFLLETYQQADRSAEVLELARDGRKVVSRAGPGSEPLEARVLLYQSDAEYRLGRISDAGLHRSGALASAKNADDATHLDLLVLAASLDLDRRALAAAELSIVGALKIYNSLGPKTRTEARFVLPLTRAHALHGELALRLGKLAAAGEAFDTAIELSARTNEPEALALRARALAARAGLAKDASAASTHTDQLRKVLETLGSFSSPLHAIDAHRAALAYFNDAGDASEALQIGENVHQAGFALAPRHIAPCVIAQPRLFAGKDELATKNLKTCAANNPREVRGQLAAVLIALTDEALDAKQRARTAADVQEALGDKLTKPESDRLSFIQTLADPEGSYDERRAARLEKRADSDQSPAAVDAYVSYLLSVGRTAEASAYTDEHSAVFFKQGQESPGMLIRLRLEAMVRQLEPVEASLFARRALSETAELAANERARIDFLLAQNEIVAARWWRAARLLDEAQNTASEKTLVEEIEAFATKFPPISK